MKCVPLRVFLRTSSPAGEAGERLWDLGVRIGDDRGGSLDSSPLRSTALLAFQLKVYLLPDLLHQEQATFPTARD